MTFCLVVVCGADNVRQQNELTGAITKMKTVYDSAVKHTVISLVTNASVFYKSYNFNYFYSYFSINFRFFYDYFFCFN